MSRRLYYEGGLPFGGWALSLLLFVRAFFWLRAYGNTSSKIVDDAESDDGAWGRGESGEGQEPRYESWGHSSSSAYKTDEEANAERMAARYHRQRLRKAERGTTDGSGSPDPDAPGARPPTVAAAAAAAAASGEAAVRKAHFAHLNRADKARVEREAMKMFLHRHVKRELAKNHTTTLATGVDLDMR